ncbi:TetR/AcrR family transcriptional regulator [Kitasatospora viridis]|uniref:TetR family transcriptional regulator n=1 Tax=Kitasatospora viridis TaxID=281105 RepID=A0A561T6N5_9ACTN|nr:TetR/AcrR family transcriptional regulator [Kitasatospora viridis]TWF82752.1 TetR family transcriptional regulator [Kitasatospora viridis]
MTPASQDRPSTAPGTRTLRRDAAQNRTRLLRAAWEVFAEQGPAAGVEEIARRAGVGMGTLYRRFPTKDALITALYDEILENILTRTRAAAAEPCGGAGLESVLWHIGAVMSSHHGGLSRLWQVVPPDVDTQRAELWELMARLLERAQAAGTVRADLTLTDVYLCVLAMRGVIDETAAQAPDAWRSYVAVVLAGFRPAGTPLAHRPADDSLVARRIAPPAERTG